MAAIFQIRRGTSDISSSITDGELYLHKGKGSLQFGSGSGNPITLLPLNVPVVGDINLSGSISASGDVRIGGNIYLGDNLANDSVNVNSPFSGSLIPSGSNIFDLGSNTYKYKNVYATSISGAIAATNGVISGSSQILGGTGIVSGSSQITYANISSIPSGIFSGSSQVDADSITNFDSNVKDKLNTDGVISGSSQVTLLLPNGVVSGSSQMPSLLPTGVVSGSSQVLGGTTIHSGSFFNGISVVSGSSQVIDILTELNSYTSSLKTAITASGTNVTINGNLTVKGTTTQIDSTTLNIGDNIIELNYGGSQTTSGIIVKDATGGSTTSGSLLWDSTNDYWKGGTLSNESKLLRADGDSVVTGSSQITPLLPTGVVSGSSQIPILLPTGIVSGSSQIPSLLPTGTISGSTQIANLGYATTGSNSFYGNQIISGNIYLTGSIIPSGSASFDLGSQDHPFRHLYVGSGSVFLGGAKALSLDSSGSLSTELIANFQGQLNVYDDVIVHGSNGFALVDYSGSNVGGMAWFAGNNVTFDNGHTATGGFDFRNTHPSCSIGPGNYMTVRPDYIYTLPASYLDLRAGTNSSIAPKIHIDGSNGNITISGSSTTIQDVNFISFSSSLDSKFTTLVGVTSSLNTFSASMNAFYTSFTQSFTDPILKTGGGFSASVDSRLDELEYTVAILDPGNIGDALLGINSFTSSTNNRLNNLEATTSSLNSFSSSINTTIKTKLDTDGVISGSSQVSYVGLSNIPSGIISSSAQIDTLFNIDGIVSGSSQVISLLPTGTISGSAQISGSIFTTISGDIAITTNGVATIQANSVALGVDTTGNYMSGLTQGTGVTISHTPGEGSTATISIAQAVATDSNIQFGSIGVGTAASGVSGEIRATGDITAFYSSDIRLKQNIQPIQNALEKIESISGNTYDWKEGYEEIHSHKGNDVGVIAQEIEEILPQIVTNRDNGYKAVQYEKIIPLLIEAIKELSAKIKGLENK
jgi:hypothetical protein